MHAIRSFYDRREPKPGNMVDIMFTTPMYSEDRLAEPTRVIAVVLSEEEWRAFKAIEPQPVAWMHQQIRDRLQAASAPANVSSGN